MLAPVSLMSILPAAVAMTLLSSAPGAEPAKTSHMVLSATSSAWTASAPASMLDRTGRASTVRGGAIASAITPLDLRKLTMSDFGDVEGLR